MGKSKGCWSSCHTAKIEVNRDYDARYVENKSHENKIKQTQQFALVIYSFVAIIPTFVAPKCQTPAFSCRIGLTVAETSESLPLDGAPVQWRSSDTRTEAPKMTHLQTSSNCIMSWDKTWLKTVNWMNKLESTIDDGVALQASKPNFQLLEHSVERRIHFH